MPAVAEVLAPATWGGGLGVISFVVCLAACEVVGVVFIITLAVIFHVVTVVVFVVSGISRTSIW